MADNVPDAVRSFFTGFAEAVKSGNVSVISQYYENGTIKQSDRVKIELPSIDTISRIVPDPLFVLLYRELQYRQIMANPKTHQTLTYDHRLGAWRTYVELFDLILKDPKVSSTEFPANWAWDIMDEFVYQLQEFHHFNQKRHKAAKAGDETVQIAKSMSNVWSVPIALQYLQSFRDKSEILSVISDNISETIGASIMSGSVVTPKQGYPIIKLCGVYSLICSLRVHCLIGDYYRALKSLSNLQNCKKEAVPFLVIPARLSLCYYMGFSHLMLLRYSDAVRTFNLILQVLGRVSKPSSSRSYQADDSLKKQEQMHSLLAILVSFTNQPRLDETVASHLQETYSDKIAKIKEGDIQIVQDLFLYGCPKWFSPATDGDDVSLSPNEFLNYQAKLFVSQVQQQLALPAIRSYLKPYSTIDTAKLASLTSSDGIHRLDESGVVRAIICYNQKTRSYGSEPSHSAGLEVKTQIYSEMVPLLEDNIIQIVDTKTTRYADMFTRNSARLDDLTAELSRP